MTVLPSLEAGLKAAAVQPIRRRARRLTIPLGCLTALAVAGGAVAAVGVLPIGDPAPDRAPLNEAHVGSLTPGSAQLLGVRTEDTDGGPEWGLRAYRTSAGIMCLQPGRVSNGQLGVIGADSKLHPAAAQVHSCQAGTSPAGLSGRSVMLADGALPVGNCHLGSLSRELPPCDAADLRTVVYGVNSHGDAFLTVAQGASVVPPAP